MISWLGSNRGPAKQLVSRFSARLSVPAGSALSVAQHQFTVLGSVPLLRFSGPLPQSQTDVMQAVLGSAPNRGPRDGARSQPQFTVLGSVPLCGSRVRSLNRRQMSCRRFSGPLPTGCHMRRRNRRRYCDRGRRWPGHEARSQTGNRRGNSAHGRPRPPQWERRVNIRCRGAAG
jgi:hypothetical protein